MHDCDRPRSHRLRAGRCSERGRIYLVTAVTRQRQPLFAHWDAGCACARALHAAPGESTITPLAWVVMPDHVHWLFSLDDGPLDRVMQRFKSRAARAMNVARGKRGAVWQAGYHDHAVRLEEDIRDLARYVIANPVRAGLVRRVGEYPFWDAAWL
ncbi:MAG: transposase [Halofilum sp. (in: g-proteobacteria)]